MTSIELTAPAKVNLFLKVLGKRRDSYHNLLTLFERIDLCDTVTISKTARSGIAVVTDRPVTADPRDNITCKAAKLIFDRYCLPGGIRISIRKRIPVAAGLGGGSSDAAAVLIGLNRLYNLKLSRQRLVRYGALLGADVPFFLLNAPFAVGRGRGDRLTAADLPVRPWHLIVFPGPYKVSTARAYAIFDKNPEKPALAKGLTRFSGSVTIKLPKDWKGLQALLYNDLGDVVAAQDPVIGKNRQCLVSSLGKRIIVAGSGPSLFCLYRTRKEAITARTRLLRRVPARMRRRWQVFVVTTRAGEERRS